jgi:hypothetical protein
MTIVWPVIVSVRHIVTTMSAQSSLSAGLFSSDVAAERSTSGHLYAMPLKVNAYRSEALDFKNQEQVHEVDPVWEPGYLF